MEHILYNSTRGKEKDITASQAIINGLASDGGLYVPNKLPKLDISIEDLCRMDYREIAYEIMKLFLTDFTEDELKYCINNAYDNKFDTEEIAPLVKKGDVYYLELFHGSTIAFKDMALSILPHLMKTAAKKQNISNDIVILTATSGDTGKAALAGFADVDGTKIIVFYPKNGVSFIQEKQMLTQKGDNTYVVGIKGNFDDAQSGVKEIFNDSKFGEMMNENGYQFSSANSINIGRLVPQIVYYVYGYINLITSQQINIGDKINIVVPTGNFGNILAAYYAKQMGLPINKLICASNENKVLYDFINNGIYNKNREFILTMSPSMDILISSNLERLLYEIADKDNEQIKQLMSMLNSKGEYTITDKMKAKLDNFFAGYATEEETKNTIKKVFKDTNYLIDTHTAVGYAVYKKYKEKTKDQSKTILASTASPYKFTRSVMTSLDKDYENYLDFELIEKMKEVSKVEIPKAIKEIIKAEDIHNTICDKNKMKEVVANILELK